MTAPVTHGLVIFSTRFHNSYNLCCRQLAQDLVQLQLCVISIPHSGVHAESDLERCRRLASCARLRICSLMVPMTVTPKIPLALRRIGTART